MWPHGHDPRWDRMQMQHLTPSGSHNLNTNANRSGCLCNDWTNIPIASTSQYHQNTHHHQQQFPQPQSQQQQQQPQPQQQQKMGHHQPQETQYASSASTCSVTRMNPQWYTRPPPTPNFFINDTPASNSREMRNRAEKLRRDKLNSYILQLATLVPMVSSSAKRMDKTSILRLTATHLRIYHTLLNGHKPKEEFDQVDSNALENLIYEQLEGFLLILTPAGRIVFVSHTVEQFLGHLQTDLMGQSIYTITAAEDHEKLRKHLSLDIIYVEWRRYFNLHLAKAGPRTEATTYEQFNVMGMIRPANNENDVPATSTNKNNLLVFFVKLYRPPALSDLLIEANKEEYITRHLIDGRIVSCDHRISFVAGYMIEEVSGLSAFKFMHREDVRWTMIGLRQMYDRGESVGWSCYRLRSRTGRFIYLRTLGYLEVDNSGVVESFVCVNTLVTEEEGKKLIREMKERYSVMINYSVTDQITENEMKNAGVEDSRTIDECIKLLITKIPTSPKTEPSASPKPSALISNESQDCFTLTELNAATAATITTTSTSTTKTKTKTKQQTEILSPATATAAPSLLLSPITQTTSISTPTPTSTSTIIQHHQTSSSIKRLQNELNDDLLSIDNDECVVGSTRRKRQKRRTVSSSSSTTSSSGVNTTTATEIILINEYQSTTTTTSTATSPSSLSSTSSPSETIVLHQTAASICRPNINDRRHNDQSSVY